jgi:hypothetical protein
MIKQIKPLISICAFLTLVISSCKKESAFDAQGNNNQSQNELNLLISQVKVWHDSTVSSNLNTKVQNGVRAFSVNENDIVPPIVDWDKAFISYDSSNVKSITVPISINYKNGEHTELVATKSKNKLNGYIIKVTPDSACFANQIDIYNYTNFSGSISIYNLMGVRLKKEIFKTGVAFKENISKNTLATKTTYESAPPCEGCTLNTVIVTGNRKIYYYTGYDYTLSYVHITYNQNLELDDFGGGGEVIAGGSDFDFDQVPNGQCVFGALAYLGSILGGNNDPKHYIKQWADENKVSLDYMDNQLLNDPNKYGPNIIATAKLLNTNFINFNLGNMENALARIKNENIKVFVIIVWPKINGVSQGAHAGIVEWSSYNQKVMFYDPVLNDYYPYEKGNIFFDNSKFFLGVSMPK